MTDTECREITSRDGSALASAARGSSPAITAAFLVAVILLPAGVAAQAGAASRPNIIFIMTDDHAAHAIGAYGSRVNKTPHLDRLAREGALLTSVFATNSICTPSRAAILTGQYSHLNGVTMFNRFDSSRMTVARLLQQGGYHTGMIGKWHLGSDPAGFDRWEILPGQGAYRDPVFYTATGEKTYTGRYATDVITDLALDFVESRPRDKPFFLMMHHKAPHRPWEPTRRARRALRGPADSGTGHVLGFVRDAHRRAAREPAARRRRPDQPRPEAAAAAGPERRRSSTKWLAIKPDSVTIVRDGKSVTLTGEALVRWKYQRYMQDYLATVQSVDDSVGRVLAFLDQAGPRPEHAWSSTRATRDSSSATTGSSTSASCTRSRSGCRSSCAGRRGIKPGTQERRARRSTSTSRRRFSTLAGLPAPAEMQGRSLLPVLRGRTPADWRTSMYYRYYHDPGDHNTRAHYGVRTRTHKLIYFWKKDQWELFDLVNDPYELHNLYGEPGQELTATLKAELARLKRELRDDDQLANEQMPNGVDGPVARLRGR